MRVGVIDGVVVCVGVILGVMLGVGVTVGVFVGVFVMVGVTVGVFGMVGVTVGVKYGVTDGVGVTSKDADPTTVHPTFSVSALIFMKAAPMSDDTLSPTTPKTPRFG